MKKGKEYTLAVAGFTEISFFEKEVSRVIVDPKVTGIVVDLDKVSFILSAVIAQIVKLFKHCSKTSIPFRVINMSDEVYETLDMLKLTQMFGVKK